MPTLLLSLALIAEGWLLLRDVPLFGPGAREPRPSASVAPLAELLSSQNDVQVQGAGEIFWSRATRGQTLYRRESVLTLDHARAEIAFLDGTGITVDENSLVQVEQSPAESGRNHGRLVVRLLRGTIHKREPRQASRLLRATPGETTPELEIRVGDATAVVSPDTELSVALAPGMPARIDVRAGELAIETPAGDARAKAGETANLGAPDALPRVSRAPFTPLSPRGGEAVAVSGENASVRVPFRWQLAPEVLEKGQSLELEASPDPRFGRTVRRVRVDPSKAVDGFLEATLDLPAGQRAELWHWRIRSGPNAGNAESFWLAPPARPELRYPPANGGARAATAIDFAWKALDGSTGYELEITGPDGPRISTASENTSRVTVAETASCSKGCRLSWRVRARLDDGTLSAWSEARALRALPSAKEPTPAELAPPPPPDELGEPVFRPETPSPRHSWLERMIVTRAYAAADEAWSVHLRWKAVPGVEAYQVQVARDAEFRRPIAEARTQGPEWTWRYSPGSENSRGQVYYRVASVGRDGRVGAFSKPRPISVPAEILARARPPVEVARAPELSPATPPVSPPSPLSSPSPSPAPTPDVASVPATDVESAASGSSAPDGVGVPAPAGGTSAAEVVEVRDTTSTRILLRGGIGGGVADLRQTSAADELRSVDVDAPYFQQAARLDALFFLSGTDPRAFLEAQFACDGAKLGPSDSLRRTAQGEHPTFRLRADLLRWRAIRSVSVPRDEYSDDLESVAAGGWSFGWGVIADREYRWIKSGPQSVDPAGALSAGLSFAVAHRDRVRAGSGLGIYESGARIGLPFTGAFGDGFGGIRADLFQEWKVGDIGRGWLGARLEADVAFLRWPSAGVFVGEWSVRISPNIHFAAF